MSDSVAVVTIIDKEAIEPCIEVTESGFDSDLLTDEELDSIRSDPPSTGVIDFSRLFDSRPRNTLKALRTICELRRANARLLSASIK